MEFMKKKKVICIVGPTASGKTSLGIELAKRLNGEIISADSMQIYKGLDIGTAKVTDKEAEGIPHHLINICDIGENFSVADFKRMCYDKIDEIIGNGKTPIIVGGTGLYISSVIYNMNFMDENTDFEYRKKLEYLAKENSNGYVYDILKKLDPESAKVIHPNNLRRVIRAIEIAKNSKELKSVHMQKEKNRIKLENKKYDFYTFCINLDREKLYKRINLRIDIMLNSGILEEAKKIYDMNLDENSTCMQAIGYKEFFPYFLGDDTLENCINNLKKDTRNYAKRQITWFKNKINCIYINGENSKEDMVNNILNNLN